MAANSTTLELALEAFNAEFSRNGYGSAPPGLMALLWQQKINTGETPDQARSRIYKRLFCLLWYGSKQTFGKRPRQSKSPTYVFPESLKEIVRRIVEGNLVDRPDPSGVGVYHVTIGDLAAAKWPAGKKSSQRNK